ncbi:MAG: ABC transporter ATP-binding protein [Candidatus Aminicenantes bacterium]|nr:ABC transporter ATP-binding protein [Candidatus Aminicenantes bacterium]
MKAVVLDNVTKYYRRFTSKRKFQTLKSAILEKNLFSHLAPREIIKAVDGVSFEIEKGETFGIIGENGSGKSTLLKLIAGITRPTSGQIKVNGKVSALIELGAGFHPEISGRENIYINGIMLGLTKKEIDEKLEEIIKFAELEDFIDMPVKTYSSGMYMRLGFSVAINVNPDILLVDEVLAVGDASFVNKGLEKIKEMKKSGKTIVFVTHALDLTQKICHRVAWMKKGKVMMIGEPKEVVDRYLMDALGKESQEELIVKNEGRWGNREVEITESWIEDLKGKKRTHFDYGEGLKIVMKIVPKKEVKDFVFGVGIFNSEGTNVYGTNTHLEFYKPKIIKGEAVVKFEIPAIHLVNGTYTVDLAVHREDGFAYDYIKGGLAFMVHSLSREVGIWRPEHRWEFEGKVEIEEYTGKEK